MNKKYYREGMRDKIEYKYQCMTCDFHHVSDSKVLYMHCPKCRIKFVKSKTDTFSNVKVVTLSNFYGTYAEAKAELESISNKTDIETIDDVDSGTNAEIKQIKSKLSEPKLT